MKFLYLITILFWTALPPVFAIVRGATHLFEEPGKLEEVALLAAMWFEEYLC